VSGERFDGDGVRIAGQRHQEWQGADRISKHHCRFCYEGRRGIRSDWVFSWEGQRLNRMTNNAWRKARKAVGLSDVRVHDLRHTFGARLRAAGVFFEDRQDLLGHYAGRITTHYSRVEIAHLIESVEKLCEVERKPEIALVRRLG
jgi:integrase